MKRPSEETWFYVSKLPPSGMYLSTRLDKQEGRRFVFDIEVAQTL